MLGCVSGVAAVLLVASVQMPEREAVVLSQPRDPYRALAREIAEAESVSDREMIRKGRFLRDHPDVAIGIITGSTPAQARALWQRAGDARGTRAAFAVAKDPRSGVGIPIGLVRDAPGGRSVHSLTNASFTKALTEVDYLTFAGHGGPAYLGLPNGARFGTADIPTLPPVVVATGSCNSVRPWVPRSLALAFVDNGAPGSPWVR
jgi:hypothetical protein